MWGHDVANFMFHARVGETSLVNDVSIWLVPQRDQ